MASLFPREEHAEALFHRILSNPGAEQQLYETFCMEQENASFEDGGGAECSFAKALLQAYENRDISALTIALCNNTMFDLLRTAYLIPYRFHGKNGGNPRLLTDANGEVREEYRNAVSARELRKFHDIYRQHLSVPLPGRWQSSAPQVHQGHAGAGDVFAVPPRRADAVRAAGYGRAGSDRSTGVQHRLGRIQ